MDGRVHEDEDVSAGGSGDQQIGGAADPLDEVKSVGVNREVENQSAYREPGCRPDPGANLAQVWSVQPIGALPAPQALRPVQKQETPGGGAGQKKKEADEYGSPVHRR
jgi:hypothetical protein